MGKILPADCNLGAKIVAAVSHRECLEKLLR